MGKGSRKRRRRTGARRDGRPNPSRGRDGNIAGQNSSASNTRGRAPENASLPHDELSMEGMSVEGQVTLLRVAKASDEARADLIDAMLFLTNAQGEALTGMDTLISVWPQTGFDENELANLLDRYVAPQTEELKRTTDRYELCWQTYYRAANSYLYVAERVATPTLREQIAEDFRSLGCLFVDEDEIADIEESHNGWPTPAFNEHIRVERRYREVIGKISVEAAHLIARAEALTSGPE